MHDNFVAEVDEHDENERSQSNSVEQVIAELLRAFFSLQLKFNEVLILEQRFDMFLDVFMRPSSSYSMMIQIRKKSPQLHTKLILLMLGVRCLALPFTTPANSFLFLPSTIPINHRYFLGGHKSVPRNGHAYDTYRILIFRVSRFLFIFEI